MSKIKAVIFDLDDTLYDCYGTIIKPARRKAVRTMIKAGLPTDYKTVASDWEKYFSDKTSGMESIRRLLKHFKISDKKTRMKVIEDGIRRYYYQDVPDIELFPDAAIALDKLKAKGYKLILLTTGNPHTQSIKVDKLGLIDIFDGIVFDDIETENDKHDKMEKVLKEFRLKAREVVSVGDKLFSEVEASNRLGMVSVQYLSGRFKNAVPKNRLEKPDYRIDDMTKLVEIVGLIDKGSKIKHDKTRKDEKRKKG